jgi:hypothetical protein
LEVSGQSPPASPAALQNGTYKIVDVPDYALDDQNGAGTNVDQQTYSGTNQQWTLTLVTGQQYKITSVASGLALSGPTTSSHLLLQPYTGTNYQLWTFQQDGSYYNVVNVKTGQGMDDWGGSGPGTIVGQWSLATTSPNRDWTPALLAAAVGPPIALNFGSSANGQLHLSFQGGSNQAYVLESSTNLGGSNWVPLLTNVPPDGFFNFVATNPSDPQRFYRVKQ